MNTQTKQTTAKASTVDKKKDEPQVTSISDPKRHRIGQPYIFDITNTSYDYIKDVRLNDKKRALGISKDDRVKAGYGFTGIELSSVLDSFDNIRVNIGRIRIEASHPYEKYRNNQLHSPLTFVKSYTDGTIHTSRLTPFYKINQFLQGIVEVECDIDIEEGWDLKFDLFPEAFIRIYLFPSEIERK